MSGYKKGFNEKLLIKDGKFQKKKVKSEIKLPILRKEDLFINLYTKKEKSTQLSMVVMCQNKVLNAIAYQEY